MHYTEDYHRSKHAYLHDPEQYVLFSTIHRCRYFPDIRPEHSVFEFACGLGQNLFSLPAARKVGFDISAYAIDFCNKMGIHATDDLTEIERHSFDFVISRHSLEHLENPFENLRILREFLKPGGILCLVVPEEPVFMPDDFSPDINNHLYSWTPRTLANLIHASGYRITWIKRLPNSGRRFLAPIARFSYRAYASLVRTADLLGRVNGELYARAKSPERVSECDDG